ncbi:MAG: hypothetical protein SFV81_22525, partial [Pirellulaceae bacterium]|nr:hypothetical protein [Pirellulaceae bacterium]
RLRGKGTQPPAPLLESWHRDRLNHDVVFLNNEQRIVAKTEIERFCSRRPWKLWVANPRSTHAHVVVTVKGYHGAKVRDQIKANCTRVIREGWPLFVDRPVWAVGGDWQCVNTEEELEQVILYATEGQDRKGCDVN